MDQQVQEERQKIIDGTYPSRIIQGRQNKHIPGTQEFEQKRKQMQRISPGSEPAILEAEAQALVDKYKGTGQVNKQRNSLYPTEIIDTDNIVGKTWVKSLQRYVNTRRIKIFYSSTGVHIVPVNNYIKR